MEEKIIWERGPFQISVWGNPEFARWFLTREEGNRATGFIHQEGFRVEDVRYFRENKIGPFTLLLGFAPETPVRPADREPTPFEYACAIATQYAEVMELLWTTAGTMSLPEVLAGGFKRE
jgi:hypothetical protein